jgi:hypothetical protein
MELLVFVVDLPFVDELKLVVLSFLRGGLNRASQMSSNLFSAKQYYGTVTIFYGSGFFPTF